MCQNFLFGWTISCFKNTLRALLHHHVSSRIACLVIASLCHRLWALGDRTSSLTFTAEPSAEHCLLHGGFVEWMSESLGCFPSLPLPPFALALPRWFEKTCPQLWPPGPTLAQTHALYPGLQTLGFPDPHVWTSTCHLTPAFSQRPPLVP